jgi:hypothetical protein
MKAFDVALSPFRSSCWVAAASLVIGCGPAAAVSLADAPEAAVAGSEQAALGSDGQDLFGHSGLLAFELHRLHAQAPKIDPRDDLSPEDPADLPAQQDCKNLDVVTHKAQVDLNQEGAWQALMRTPQHDSFAKLARAANARSCRVLFKDPGDKERDDTAVLPEEAAPQASQSPNRQLAYGCDVLTDKLQRAYGLLENITEMQALRGTLTWQRFLDHVDLSRAAHCWP